MNTTPLRSSANALPAPGAMSTASNSQPMRQTVRTPMSAHAIYLVVLTWAFTLFNSVRVLSYVPTIWAIQHSGDSSQHSLITWLTWLGANVTMSLWLWENNHRRLNKAIVINTGNAAMCLATALLIAWHRF